MSRDTTKHDADAQSRESDTAGPTEAELKSEDQFRKMGAAYSSLTMQILSLCIGETVQKLQRSLDPEVSRQDSILNLLQDLESRPGR